MKVLGLLKRGFSKLVWGPLRYSRGDGYDAERYWADRLGKHGASLRGPGHEGLSEEENRRAYEAAGAAVLAVCQRERIEFARCDVLEVGCGTGVFTELLEKQGVREYTGVDITDVRFPALRARFPRYRFQKADICSDSIEGEFGMILIIDVLEHVVEEAKLEGAMANVRRALAVNGVVIVALPLAPAGQSSKKHLFYVRSWTQAEITNHFPGFVVSEVSPFPRGHIFTIRKPPTREN